jgi:hypothetical protein
MKQNFLPQVQDWKIEKTLPFNGLRFGQKKFFNVTDCKDTFLKAETVLNFGLKGDENANI